MDITLFDGFAVRVDAQTGVTFQSNKVRALAAYLAAHANRPIQRTHLAALFWGDKPDDVARSNLRNTLARLKKAFAPLLDVAGDHLLTITRTTVQLVTTAVFPIDVARYDALWAQCKAVARESWVTDEQVMGALGELVSLYGGLFLAGLELDDCAEFDDWVGQQQELYHQRTLTALEALTEWNIAHEEFERAEAYGLRQLELEAWHEMAHRQLIAVYSLTRRPRLAQRQLEQCQAILRETFGIDPAPETVALLEGQPAGLPVKGKRRQHRVAAATNAFVGREAEVVELQRLLADDTVRFITLHGEGGIGKTRLARTVGALVQETFADGAAFVSLVEASRADDIPDLFLKSLQVRPMEQYEPLAQLRDYLRERELLLIVDNLEHLLQEAETAVLLLNLLAAAPRLKLLVTSRQQVWVQAETVVRLGGLPVPKFSANGTWRSVAAVQLFVARMQQLNPRFDPSDKREAIIRICCAVQGLPLGIELAAAESHLRSCEVVAQALRDDLALETRMRDVPQRQASLQNVFDSSWRLLQPELRLLAARCGIMRGDFSAEAFMAVTGGRRDQLQTLVDHAIVRRVEADRYDMHEVVRHFALERLETADLVTARSRHSTYFMQLVARQEEALITDMETAVTTIRRDWQHIDVAWNHAVENATVELFDAAVTALCTYWIYMGHFSTTLAKLEAARNCLANIPDPHPRLTAARAKVMGALIWIAFTSGEIKKAIDLAQRVLHEAQQDADEPFPIIAATCTLGSAQMLRGHLANAERLATQGYELATEHRMTIWQVVAIFLMIMLLSYQGRLAECEVWAQRAVDCTAHNRFLQMINVALWNFQIWKLSTHLAQAEETRRVLRRLGQYTCIDGTFIGILLTSYRCGDFEQVIEVYNAARRDVSLDDRQLIRHGGYYVLANTERRRGNLEAALRYGQLAVEHTANLAPAGSYYFWACDALGLALCAVGQPVEAQNLLLVALDHVHASELADSWHIVIEGSLAHSYAVAGDWQSAYDNAAKLVDRLLAADVATAHLEQTWFCYEILARGGHPRAAELLAHMQSVVWQRAELLEPRHRYTFLNNFPEHRAIMARAGLGVV